VSTIVPHINKQVDKDTDRCMPSRVGCVDVSNKYEVSIKIDSIRGRIDPAGAGGERYLIPSEARELFSHQKDLPNLGWVALTRYHQNKTFLCHFQRA
jgi:hypothetical protein